MPGLLLLPSPMADRPKFYFYIDASTYENYSSWYTTAFLGNIMVPELNLFDWCCLDTVLSADLSF